MTRALATIAATCALLTAATPASAAETSDPLRTLGGDSPLCTNTPAGLDQQTRADCRATGALEHPYPLSRYRFDWHIDTGITSDPTNNLLAAIQWLLAMAWLALLYVLKGVLLAFQWAFSLDPLSEAMRPTSHALTNLHTRTLGQPWMLAAISILGLWGIWRGIVQRRTVETAAGLAAAVVMMAAALYIIAKPADTIGRVSQGANDVSLGFLSGAAEGTLRQPSRTVADSSRSIFDAVILRPWCAINFADVTWCLSKAPGDHLTRAERWLQYEPDSRARNAEWQIIDDPESEPWTEQPDILGIDIPGTDSLEKDNEKIKDQLAGYTPTAADKQRIQIQGKSQTVIRVALFLLIAAGITGCILLIGWLSLNVLYQGLLTLILLLAAPAMLLAPAFGENGRRLFTVWAKRLLAAAIAKAIYALLLAIVLAINAIITGLDGELPWLAVWLLAAVFWWGTFLRRDDLLGWLSLGSQKPADASRTTSKQTTLTGPAVSALATAAGAPTAATLALKATAANRQYDQQQGLQTAATDELRGRASERLDHRYQLLHSQLTEHDDAKEKTQGLTRRINTLDRQIDQAQNATRTARTDKTRAAAEKRSSQAKAQRGKLITQRKHLEPKLLSRPEEGVARRFIETADRNQIETGGRYTPRQLDLQIEELRADAQLPADDQRHEWRKASWKPGLPESQLEQLTPDARRKLSQHLSDQLDRDRALLAAIPTPDRPATPSRRQTVKARRHIDTRTLKDHTHRARDLRRDPAPPPAHHR